MAWVEHLLDKYSHTNEIYYNYDVDTCSLT